jgi:3-methyladenine DNA glycosylase AlkD
MPANTFTDPRLQQLAELFVLHGNPADGQLQQRYHKTTLTCRGLKAAQQRKLVQQLFAGRLERAEHLPLVAELWRSSCMDERVAALLLLERLVKQLTAGDLPWLMAMTRDCDGWALLDCLATRMLGPLALAQPRAVYPVVQDWLDDGWLWTRRAAILIHVLPARREALAHDYAWPSFAARLAEREFFIRKAIGWALRECCRHYPQQVADFLNQHAGSLSGLTWREGSRQLPPVLRAQLSRPGR